jgi:hypothetical protein
MLGRARDLLRRPHVIGYNRAHRPLRRHAPRRHPAEIDLYALARFVEDPSVSADRVTSEFVSAHYGAAARPFVTRAFRNAFDIVTSSLYTLGTNVANHSRLDYDAYSSELRAARERQVDRAAGRAREARREPRPALLARRRRPDRTSAGRSRRARSGSEVPVGTRQRWIHPGERMDEPRCGWCSPRSDWGVAKARESTPRDRGRATRAAPRRLSRPARTVRADAAHRRLHEGVASAYYGFRVWYARRQRAYTGGDARHPRGTAGIADGRGGDESVPVAATSRTVGVGEGSRSGDESTAIGSRRVAEVRRDGFQEATESSRVTMGSDPFGQTHSGQTPWSTRRVGPLVCRF